LLTTNPSAEANPLFLGTSSFCTTAFLTGTASIFGNSLQMATETNAPAAAAPAVPATKPTKPDEEVFKKEVAKLEKEHKAALDKYVSAAQ
jgi:hypothetical protein